MPPGQSIGRWLQGDLPNPFHKDLHQPSSLCAFICSVLLLFIVFFCYFYINRYYYNTKIKFEKRKITFFFKKILLLSDQKVIVFQKMFFRNNINVYYFNRIKKTINFIIHSIFINIKFSLKMTDIKFFKQHLFVFYF